ncbi:hypothetical protein HDV06_001416 [Boothiomyces sp. JEL0866]|nr:hypothetical protein HDV06_001416 [Boothiomyces sp. JEL0866]
MNIQMLFSTLISAASAAPALQSASIDRYFVIVFENQYYDDVMADPYLGTTLPKIGQLLTNVHGDNAIHPSLPNYLYMISGSDQGVDSDNPANVDASVQTIVDLLEARGKTWGGYMEGIPSVCFDGKASGNYVRKHNPFQNFLSISQNPARCAMIKDASLFANDVTSGNVPNYVFYTPDQINDMHDKPYTEAIPNGSKWLQGFLTPLLSNPLFKNTLFYITFDENRFAAGDNDNNHIYGLLIGPGATPGKRDNTLYSHSSQLAWLENHWSLANLGTNDATSNPFALN